jgi:hypothetical protein
VRDLCALLQSAPSPAAQLYGCLVLANKLLSQCDAQLTKLQSFAFPLATVAVHVGAAFPCFMDVLVAKLHRACMFTVRARGACSLGPLAVPVPGLCCWGVGRQWGPSCCPSASEPLPQPHPTPHPPQVPKYIRKQQGQAAEEYARAIGYREVDGSGGAARLESGDEYSSRVQGYVLLYAAITQVGGGAVQLRWAGRLGGRQGGAAAAHVCSSSGARGCRGRGRGRGIRPTPLAPLAAPGLPQVDERSNPHGLQHAWAYVARSLNYMPATRNSAMALQAFLRVAGYSMAKVGGGHATGACPLPASPSRCRRSRCGGLLTCAALCSRRPAACAAGVPRPVLQAAAQLGRQLPGAAGAVDRPGREAQPGAAADVHAEAAVARRARGAQAAQVGRVLRPQGVMRVGASSSSSGGSGLQG